MRSFLSGTLTVLALLNSVCAWGGLFNRFSPEMLSNLGYGSHGGYRAQPFLQQLNPVEVFQELQEDEEPCYGKKCTANEHCCPGSVCVDVDGIVGSCLFAYGLKQGELCRRDNDCVTGLLCTEIIGEGRTCQPPTSNKKLYSEDCTMSSECDIGKGLCCQLQRRHRQAARKVCSYFKDPLICIGPVATDQVKDNNIEHTAGEKRLTGKAVSVNAFGHMHRRK
ncbi:prohormone-3 isoform X1 [Zootermopsis nevadensis]|uniref:prohormone-3 isoform X1 n=1 Tax=Zootermopsis nevadensis TaxID=136037 RepID=UPI000B8EC3E3|nr:prohormone-3 isoform X1 [Zootermopsis nevadensis]XP_021918859.1 prohormone-3 isoform X1 [Zootermopsis nevadensis]